MGTNQQTPGTGASGASRPGFDRRSLIKGAAAAGAVAWSTPTILATTASPAAAGTRAAGCWKYQYNWALGPDQRNMVDCMNTPKGPAQVWNDPCTAALPIVGQRAGETSSQTTSEADRYKSNSIGVNRNCCHVRSPNGQWDWWNGLPGGDEAVATWDTPACIIVTSSLGGCATDSGLSGGAWIRFEIDHDQCPNCYFADPTLLYTADAVSCTSQSDDDSGSSRFLKGIQYTFNGSNLRFPVYFKAWIACDLNWRETGGDQSSYVPNTQCDLPKGFAGANPGYEDSDVVNGVFHKSL